MTLRNRLIAALLLVVLAISSAASSITYFQQRFVHKQIDVRLERLGKVAELIVTQSEIRSAESQLLLDALWEGYVGVFKSDGTLSKVNAPESDPFLQPDVDLYSASVEPQTQRTREGVAKRIRTMTIPLSDGRVALVGLATTEADDVIAQLKGTLVVAGLLILFLLSLTAWWVYRLGLLPIKLMTREAQEIADGKRQAGFTTAFRPSMETAQLEQSMNRAIAATQQSELRMRRFLADASHELRTPLTSLQGYSSLYLSGGLHSEEQITDAMRRIHDESLRMSRLVNELLELNNLEERWVRLKTTFSLLPLLENLKLDVNVLQPMRPIHIDCPESVEITGDEPLIFQAILNLVSNALRHTGTDVHITIIGSPYESGTRIEVRDRGHGIASDDLPHLFDRFYRVDQGRAAQSGGTGLGLSIVAEIMRYHGGEFGVDSTLGVGTAFWLQFPNS